MTSPRGIGGTGKRAPPVDGSREAGARWTGPLAHHVAAMANGKADVVPRGHRHGVAPWQHVDGLDQRGRPIRRPRASRRDTGRSEAQPSGGRGATGGDGVARSPRRRRGEGGGSPRQGHDGGRRLGRGGRARLRAEEEKGGVRRGRGGTRRREIAAGGRRQGKNSPRRGEEDSSGG